MSNILITVAVIKGIPDSGWYGMAYNILIFSSITYALKAQGIIEREGIKTKLEKLKKGKTLHGCGYGLKIRNVDIIAAKNAVEKERIKIIDIIDFK